MQALQTLHDITPVRAGYNYVTNLKKLWKISILIPINSVENQWNSLIFILSLDLVAHYQCAHKRDQIRWFVLEI